MLDEGASYLLSQQLRREAVDPLPWQLLLFTEPEEIDSETTYADFVEASFGGYNRRTLTSSEWTEPVVVDGVATSTYTDTPQTWTVTDTPQTIYGYAVVTTGGTPLALWAEIIGPIELSDGYKIGVLPRLERHTYEPCP